MNVIIYFLWEVCLMKYTECTEWAHRDIFVDRSQQKCHFMVARGASFFFDNTSAFILHLIQLGAAFLKH